MCYFYIERGFSVDTVHNRPYDGGGRSGFTRLLRNLTRVNAYTS
jgi:hypothetical protein